MNQLRREHIGKFIQEKGAVTVKEISALFPDVSLMTIHRDLEKLEEERAELEAQEHELMEEKESLEIILTEKKAVYEDYEAQLTRARQEAAVYKANILTIHQSIPVSNVATLTLSVEVRPDTGDISGMVGEMERETGVHYVKIIARE